MKKSYLLILTVLLTIYVAFAQSCGSTISTNTVLSADVGSVASPCVGTALVLGSGADLDCNGFSIIGDGTGQGIATGSSSIIENCNIINFTQGIRMGTVSNVVIDNTNISDVDKGIEFYRSQTNGNAQNIQITNVTAKGNTYGMYYGDNLYHSLTNFTVIDNDFSNSSSTGIHMDSRSYTANGYSHKFINNNVSNSNQGIFFKLYAY